jgi:two-component system response regulator (stage 0 sporulation protein F)
MKINNIFLVEDDDFFAATFVKRLEKVGDFEIHRFFDCEHALRELLNVKPEIVFLDHKMKGLDGVDALPLFLENLPSVEVAIVSGQTDPDVLKKAMDRGASHYFQKDVLLMKHAEGFIESLTNKKSKLSSFSKAFLFSKDMQKQL